MFKLLLLCLACFPLAAFGAGEYVIDTPGDITDELQTALETHTKIIIDEGTYTVDDDIELPGARHIVVEPGAVLSFADNPVLDDGKETHEPSGYRYGTGLFVTRSPGSIFECYGTINLNAENIPDQGAEQQHVAFVFLKGAHNSKIFGNCNIQHTFNGVTVIDSDDVYVQGLHLTNPPVTAQRQNAAVDVEASDRVYVIDTSAIGYEEVVDFNIQNYGGYVSVFGEGLTQNAVEINNSVGIRGFVWAENSNAYSAFNYNLPNGSFRWSDRNRNTPGNSQNSVVAIDMGDGAGETPPPPPPPTPQCDDELDNDGDSLVDLTDPGCSTADDDNETDPVLPSGDTLVSVNGDVNDTNNLGLTNPLQAVEFTLEFDSVVEGVGLKGTRGNNTTAGTFKLELWRGGALPGSGTLVKSETFSNTVLPAFTANPVMTRINFTTPTDELPAGTYYLTLTVLTGNSSDAVRWSKDTNNAQNAVYSSFWYYYNNQWTEVPNHTLNFDIYGSI